MSLDQNVKFCCYNTLILKYPYDGKDNYTQKAKGGVLYGENLDSRYGSRIANKISQLDCDCIGLQEINKACFDKLAEQLWQKGYTGIFSNRNNGEDEGLAIFYKTRRFELISNNTNYFNDGSGRGIFDLGLKIKEVGSHFHFMTTHIDYRTEHMQREFNALAEYASKIAGPKIVCGDFNVTPDNPMLQPMWDKRLYDSLYGNPAPSFFDRRIDYILTSPEVISVSNAQVIGDPQKLSTAEEPSDHLPLVATAQLRAEPSTNVSAKKTRIIVKCDVGLGDKLWIRGNGPGMMDWGKGIELRNVDTDTWVFETQDDLPNFEYKVLRNDKDWETAGNHQFDSLGLKPTIQLRVDSFENAPAKTTQIIAKAEPSTNVSAKKTQVTVKCDVGLGNSLCIRGNGPGMMDWGKAIELRNVDKDTWVFETQGDLPNFEYKILRNDKAWESGGNHQFNSLGQKPIIQLRADSFENAPAKTTQIIAKAEPSTNVSAKKTQITVKCDVGLGNSLCIRGNGPEMMNWGKAIELRNVDKDTWVFETQDDLPNFFEYKILRNDKDWETDGNHQFTSLGPKPIIQLRADSFENASAKTTQVIGKNDRSWETGNNHQSAQEKLNLLARRYSETTFQAARPYHVDSATTDLETAQQALRNLNQACKTNDIHQIKIQFNNLPKDTREFLLWAIWIEDSLGSKPINGIGHSWGRFDSDPMIIGSKNAKKVIYMAGDSLVEQLLNYTTEALLLKYQEQIAIHLDKEHPEQKKLVEMQMAKDLRQYTQMITLKPLITTQEQRLTFENYLLPRVRSWLNTACELYETRGAHQRDNKTTFSVYAPHAQNVQCLLTSFGKIERIVDMQKQTDGTWMASIDKVNPGTTYLYRVKDCHGKSTDRVDPFSFGNIHIPETDTVHSVVVDRNRFAWNDSGWLAKRTNTQPLEQPLSIYEVHTKSWTDGNKNLREIAHQLAAYCKELGFTHVELYGIMEHFWGKARGYQVTNFFAPYHNVGSYEDMKYFVNYMHEQGLGVIIDWIPAHYDHAEPDPRDLGSSMRHLGSSMHQFDGTDLFGTEKSGWGTTYVDYSKPEAQRLMEASAFWWLKEFHLDGIRVDAVSQLVKRNNRDVQSGIEFLGRLNDRIHASCPGVLTIAEATDWDPRVCQPTAAKGFGFDLNWSVGSSHNLRNYLRTPENERSKHEHHRDKLERIFQEGQRANEKKIATHSHDDMDSGTENHDKTLYNLGKNHSNETQRLADIRNFFAWQIFGPNWGHLIHMGDEFAQPESWYARFQKNQSSMQWDRVNQALHRTQREFVKDAINHYKSEEGFWKQGGANSELIYSHDSNKVIAYARGKNIVVHNFSNTGYNSYDIPVGSRFKEIARMQEKLNSDAVHYNGSGKYLNGNVSILHDGGSHKLNVKLPPRSTLVFSNVNIPK